MPVGDLVGHPGPQLDAPPVLELGLELPLEDQDTWPLRHQWFARYPGEYSTIRTRMPPTSRVRHVAAPVSPA
jgi:hypothetical protein